MQNRRKEGSGSRSNNDSRSSSRCDGSSGSIVGSSRWENHHKINAEAAEAQDKDEEILVLIQERKTTAKHEKVRILEISNKIKKCIR